VKGIFWKENLKIRPANTYDEHTTERNNIASIEGQNMIYQYPRRESQMTRGRW
jgi:hypothetical protein